MNPETKAYNLSLSDTELPIAEFLATEIDKNLPKAENKIWHRHPVWFLEGNPIVGYSKLKSGMRLLFWSGVSFDEKELKPGSGKFKDASITYTAEDQINTKDLKRWLKKAKNIQWDYKNVVKRKGKLVKLKP